MTFELKAVNWTITTRVKMEQAKFEPEAQAQAARRIYTKYINYFETTFYNNILSLTGVFLLFMKKLHAATKVVCRLQIWAIQASPLNLPL